ncbi:MAG: flagellin FliC [Nitrospina sp.]|jgi:flagellin|nr:flagellin FliC [Nitrospina sp.]MBT6716702.1 flagellin FliC [Nitrospina sp.]
MANNSIANNSLSQTAQRFLGINNERVGRSIERVAFGTRVNKGADDVAGLAISESLRSDIRTLRQGERNANDGVSLINVIEGALNVQSNILIRLRELATQASSGTVGEFERQTLQLEFSALREEIDRIAATTEFNGKTLINGALSSSVQSSLQLSIQVGLDSSSENRINLNEELNLSASNSTGLQLAGLSISTAEDALIAAEQIKNSFNTISTARGNAGALQNRFHRTLGNLGTIVENLSQADSTIRDADIAEELALLTRNQILSNAAVSMVGQTNFSGQNLLNLLQ